LEHRHEKAALAGRIPHDFRRTAVRNLVRAGISEQTAMKLTGHKTRSVFDRYAIVDEPDLLEAGSKLAALHRAQIAQASKVTRFARPAVRASEGPAKPGSGALRHHRKLFGVKGERMEAASGLEPENRGFADLRLSHLATPP
jgi:hypothetical protein